MILGFTGTRNGMTAAQRATVDCLLIFRFNLTEAHHGDCLGADDEFANLCHALTPRPKIYARPGFSAKGYANDLRANNPHADVTHPEKTHFARNRDIVDVCDVLLVVPVASIPQTSGGTWYSFGYAKKKKKPIVVVWPDGTVEKIAD